MSESQHVCEICGADDWHGLDQLRSKDFWFNANMIYDEEIGFKVCKECGFVTYAPRWTEEQWRKHYNTRMPVNKEQVSMANKKNAFHARFLFDVFGNKETGLLKDGLTILDIGCAFGNIRQIFRTAKIYGTEYSDNMARFAQRVHSIDIVKETADVPDNSCDLVMLYHTLEHVMEPRKVLQECRRILKEDGYLYVAVPDYFDTLREVSGAECFEFENLYHLNHQNVFSVGSLDNLLSVSGFETIKKDGLVYGYATLSRKCEPTAEIKKANWHEIEKTLVMQRQAMDVYKKTCVPEARNMTQDKVEELCEVAIGVYPKYVDPYIKLIETRKYYRDVQEAQKLLVRAEKSLGYNIRLRTAFALKVFINWGDPNNKRELNNYVRMAESMMAEMLNHDPGNVALLMGLFQIAAVYRKSPALAQQYINVLTQLHPLTIGNIQDVMGMLMSQEEIGQ
ncbi:MAG: class I SAM-dependent methyltransferase [Phycisphaerae bacterium]|nr:class I SAM-dependent methyltransferase [Phycisphaerae bacterium]